MLRGVLLSLLCFTVSISLAAGDSVLRVLVLDNAPPLSFRDEAGQLTGFSVEIARALCSEMRVRCDFAVSTQSALVEALAKGKADIAAGLPETPERRGKLLFAKPYFRSLSLWLARPGVLPGQAGIRVAVVSGSAQEAYGRRQGWDIQGVPTNGELAGPVLSGQAQAALVPMISVLGLQKNAAFRRLDLAPTVLHAPELGGDASFGISPRHPELKEEINAALERIKRNGTYDRINSRFLPFRVS